MNLRDKVKRMKQTAENLKKQIDNDTNYRAAKLKRDHPEVASYGL